MCCCRLSDVRRAPLQSAADVGQDVGRVSDYC